MTTINVSNLTELYSALASAKGGETIALAGGNYGDFALLEKTGIDRSFASNVTITSADLQNPAVFTGMDLRDTTNLTLDGLTFDYNFQKGDELYTNPFSVEGSQNITIRNATFDGDVAKGVSEVADGYGYAIALTVRNSEDITIENNEISNFHRGLSTNSVDGLVVSGNDVHSLRSDGLNFAAVTNVVIEDNYLHDFRASTESSDHRDMIQFWTQNTETPSKNIIIRGNHLDIGSGDYTQSIFIRNEVIDRGEAGEEMFYRNITIEDNTIVNGQVHGINVGQTNGLVIKGNTVLHSDGGAVDGADSALEIPRIAVSGVSRNVEITQNATALIAGYDGQSSWTVKNNALVQDQDATAPGFYADVFIASSLQIDEGTHDFRALPGGMLDVLQAGSSTTLSPPEADALSAQFHILRTADNAALHHFDAAHTITDADALPQGTTFTWNFGDGTTANGAQVAHSFANGGTYDVSLTVTLPDGTTDTRALALDVAGTQVFSYTANTGATAHENNLSTALSLGQPEKGEGIVLDAKGIAAQVDRSYVERILDANEMSIDMTISADNAASMGEVVRLHGSFVVSVTSAGEVHLRANAEDGSVIRLTTQGANIKDTREHDVNISLKDGVLSLSVDGETPSSTEIQGKLANSGGHDLTFGNPWSGQNFEGAVSELFIDVDESQFTGVASTTIHGAPTTHYAPLAQEDVNASTAFADPLEALQVLAAKERRDNDVEGPLEAPVTLEDAGTSARVAREDLGDLLQEEEFGISMTLSAAGAESGGEVMRLHQSFALNTTDNGEVSLNIFSEDGTRHRLTTEGAGIADGQAHNIGIARENGVISLQVDGVILVSQSMPLPMSNRGTHDLVLGNPWGKENFDGVVANLSLDALGEATLASPTPLNAATDTPDVDSVESAAGEEDASGAPHAFANAQAWADQGLITEAMLERFENIMTAHQENYFE